MALFVTCTQLPDDPPAWIRHDADLLAAFRKARDVDSQVWWFSWPPGCPFQVPAEANGVSVVSLSVLGPAVDAFQPCLQVFWPP